MPDTIWQSIASTPWWAFIFAAFVIRNCYLATKPRYLTLKQLYLLPTMFVCLSSMCMGAMMSNITMPVIAVWANFILLGTGIGYLQFNYRRIEALPHLNALRMPGTMVPGLMLIIGLLLKYYFGFKVNINLLALVQPKYLTFMLAGYGLVSGIFLGHLGYALRMLRASHTETIRQQTVVTSPH